MDVAVPREAEAAVELHALFSCKYVHIRGHGLGATSQGLRALRIPLEGEGGAERETPDLLAAEHDVDDRMLHGLKCADGSPELDAGHRVVARDPESPLDATRHLRGEVRG